MLKSCTDWASSHIHAVGYLDILVERGCIAPAQADYIIKQILVDESGKKYDSDSDPEVCAYEIWRDLRNIPGYFIKPDIRGSV